MFNRSVNHAICSEQYLSNLTKFIFIEGIKITGLKLLRKIYIVYFLENTLKAVQSLKCKFLSVTN